MEAILFLTEQNLKAVWRGLTHDMNVRSEKISPPFSIFYGL